MPEKVEYVTELKYDGNACNLQYKNGKLKMALSRGDGVGGEDITLHSQATATRLLQRRKPTRTVVKAHAYSLLCLCTRTHHFFYIFDNAQTS